MNMEGYNVRIEKTLFGEVKGKLKVQLKDTSNAMSIEKGMTFKPIAGVMLHIENPRTSEGEKEYDVAVIVAHEGVYKTSSQSFVTALCNIMEDVAELEEAGEEWEVEVTEQKSKNNQGSFFLAKLV